MPLPGRAICAKLRQDKKNRDSRVWRLPFRYPPSPRRVGRLYMLSTSPSKEADVEVIPIQQINEAYERTIKGQVKYRFVIDIASLKDE